MGNLQQMSGNSYNSDKNKSLIVGQWAVWFSFFKNLTKFYKTYSNPSPGCVVAQTENTDYRTY